jgi:hypothetical protein
MKRATKRGEEVSRRKDTPSARVVPQALVHQTEVWKLVEQAVSTAAAEANQIAQVHLLQVDCQAFDYSQHLLHQNRIFSYFIKSDNKSFPSI